MDPRMLNQIESQPKLHRVLVNGHEVLSTNVLLVALQALNQAIKEFGSANVEFRSACTFEACTFEGKKQ